MAAPRARCVLTRRRAQAQPSGSGVAIFCRLPAKSPRGDRRAPRLRSGQAGDCPPGRDERGTTTTPRHDGACFRRVPMLGSRPEVRTFSDYGIRRRTSSAGDWYIFRFATLRSPTRTDRKHVPVPLGPSRDFSTACRCGVGMSFSHDRPASSGTRSSPSASQRRQQPGNEFDIAAWTQTAALDATWTQMFWFCVQEIRRCPAIT